MHPRPFDFRECSGNPCRSYGPGHNMHFIHAKRLGATSWGWRDALVERAAGRTAKLRYLEDQTASWIWHHRTLELPLTAGLPVRLHEEHRALEAGGLWYSVVIQGGLGPTAAPVELPEAQVTAVVLGTGLGMVWRG
jgi:hypothetical protein